jgi:spore coat protein U-like protein
VRATRFKGRRRTRVDGSEGDQLFATSSDITFTTTPPYTAKVDGTVSYGKSTTTTVKVTIHIDVHGTCSLGSAGSCGFEDYGAPTGTVSADDSFTCGALRPFSGKIVSKATCKGVIPITTSEDVEIGYS